jgi:hypothetical protein
MKVPSNCADHLRQKAAYVALVGVRVFPDVQVYCCLTDGASVARGHSKLSHVQQKDEQAMREQNFKSLLTISVL